MDFEYKQLLGKEAEDWIEEIAKLRMRVFKEFPYLYEGSFDYEEDYLKTYIQAPRSLIILALENKKVIGASTCIPLSDEVKEFTAPFMQRDLNVSKGFYFGESIIYPEFRGQKIGHRFFELREKHAKATIKDLEFTTFCAVDRGDNHRLKPLGYRPLDDFWKRMGYIKDDDFVSYFPWKDIDKAEVDKKKMVFWIKAWD